MRSTSKICLQPHRQHHEEEVILPIGGDNDARGNGAGQLQGHFFPGGGLQGLHHVAVIEADLQPVAASLHGAAVLGIADGSAGGDVDFPLPHDAPQGAFQFFTDNEGHPLNAGEELLGLHCDLDGVVSGDGLAPSQELPFQPPGDEDGVPHFEEDVAGPRDRRSPGRFFPPR